MKRPISRLAALLPALVLFAGCAGSARVRDEVHVVTASAYGLPAKSASTPVEKRMTALEAARSRAMAKLAEALYGSRVVRATKVRDLQFAGEEVQSQTAGDLREMRVIQSDYDEESGIAEVVVQVGVDFEGKVVRLDGPLSGALAR